MENSIIQILSIFWLPLCLWTMMAALYLVFRQFVDKHKLNVKAENNRINSLLWALPLSIIIQIVLGRLFTWFDELNRIPEVFALAYELDALAVLGQNQSAAHLSNIINIIIVIWLSGILIGLTRLIGSWFVLKRDIAKMPLIAWSNLNLSNAHLNELLSFELLLRKSRLRISEKAISPSVVNGWNPTIILPKELISDKDLVRVSLLHELIHIKNGDLNVALINQLVRIIFWFHPFVHLLVKQASCTREQICDYEVINMGFIDKARYASILVEVSSRFTPYSLVSMSANVSQLKLRVEDISAINPGLANNYAQNPYSTLGFMLLSITLCLILLFPTEQKNISTSLQSVLPVKSEIETSAPKVVGGIESLFSKLVYPDKAKYNGIEGRVVAEFIIDENGFAKDISIIRGIGYGCDEAVIQALASTNFEPNFVNGMPVKTKATFPIVFKLKS